MSSDDIGALVAAHIRDVPDFPLPGVLFKDLTPLFADGPALHSVVDAMVERQGAGSFDVVAGVEARGFVLAGAISYLTGAGIVLVRKVGKLPRDTVAQTYDLEYGQATLEMHADSFVPGSRVLVVDDVLATGGTIEATLQLIGRVGGALSGISVLLELGFLGGRARLAPHDVDALLRQ